HPRPTPTLFPYTTLFRSTIQLVPAAKDAALPAVPTSFCVPVSMRLTTTGVLGLAGPVDASRALARWLVAQAAVLHSPRDLSIVRSEEHTSELQSPCNLVC